MKPPFGPGGPNHSGTIEPRQRPVAEPGHRGVARRSSCAGPLARPAVSQEDRRRGCVRCAPGRGAAAPPIALHPRRIPAFAFPTGRSLPGGRRVPVPNAQVPAARLRDRRRLRGRRLRQLRLVRLDVGRLPTAATSLADCTPDTLDTVTSGTLTVGTDKPAYPPYFEDDDPTNGKGFESAVAYAIADQLGFSQDRGRVDGRAVQLLLRARPEGLRLRRQPDLDHPEARRAGRLLVALLHGQPGGRRAEGLRRRRRDLARRPRRTPTIGVQIGTTSLDAVERGRSSPSSDPQVFDNSNDVVTALKQGQVDAVVVDLPTALYLTAVQVPDGDDRRPVPGPGRRPVGRAARQGLAADRLRLGRRSTSSTSSGELDEIQQQWMSKRRRRPELAVADRDDARGVERERGRAPTAAPSARRPGAAATAAGRRSRRSRPSSSSAASRR